MSRYIDADDLIKTLEEKLKEGIFQSYVLSACRGAINKQSTADVVEVVHADWGEYGEEDFFCTACDGIVENPTPYCPNCGARMDGKKVE